MSVRIIPVLHVKGPNLVKGIHLEGLRVLGKPESFAKRYYDQGADEIIYLDTVASLYGRNNLQDIVRRTTAEIFIPVAVGGGVRSVDDARTLMLCGCEKVCLNTAATKRPTLLTELADAYGSQAVVAYIEARRKNGSWEALTDNGREETGRNAVEWAHEAVDRGAGEILLTSVDREGTGTGFDLDLISKLADLRIPVIVNGGAGNRDHVAQAVYAGADAVGIASVLHYADLATPGECDGEGNTDFLNGKRGPVRRQGMETTGIPGLKDYLNERGVKCRMIW